MQPHYNQTSGENATPSGGQLNHAVNTESPESGKWEKLNIQKPRQEPGLSNNPYARYSKTRFSQIYKALYGDAMLVSHWRAQIWPPET